MKRLHRQGGNYVHVACHFNHCPVVDIYIDSIAGFKGQEQTLDGHDSQHMVSYVKALLCVSGPVRLAIIVDKFKRIEMIPSMLSDHNEIKLEFDNGKKSQEIQKHVNIKQYLLKQYIGQKGGLKKILKIF